MNNIFFYILLLIFFSNCSFNSQSSFWTKEKKIKEQAKYIKIYKFSENEEISINEFNKDIKLKFNAKLLNNSFVNNLDNNNSMISYDGSLQKVSKYNPNQNWNQKCVKTNHIRNGTPKQQSKIKVKKQTSEAITHKQCWSTK